MRILPCIIYLVFLCGFSVFSQNTPKVIGYLPSYRFSQVPFIEFQKLTHLNIAFANPDMNGQFSVEGVDVQPVVQAAKNQGCKVYIALAGGALTSQWWNAWDFWLEDNKRTELINSILLYVQTHNFDGVDLDLEWTHVDERYSPFAIQLSQALRAQGFGFTSALPATHRYPTITNDALQSFDWVNIMAYDLRGPWAPNEIGQHAPYNFAVQAIDHWENQGLSKEKLTLGVPFYGYRFANGTATSRTYRFMVDLNPQNADEDFADLTYYNGIPTIVEKTDLAATRTSGIMIWELGQDHYSNYSLLSAISERMQTYTTVNGVTADFVIPRSAMKIGPNPARHFVKITNESQSDIPFKIVSRIGQVIMSKTVVGGGTEPVQVGDWAKGLYVVQWYDGKKWISKKILVM